MCWHSAVASVFFGTTRFAYGTRRLLDESGLATARQPLLLNPQQAPTPAPAEPPARPRDENVQRLFQGSNAPKCEKEGAKKLCKGVVSYSLCFFCVFFLFLNHRNVKYVGL